MSLPVIGIEVSRMSDQADIDCALVEFEHCVKQLLVVVDELSFAGCEYALKMAKAELQLLGVNPSTVTPLDCDAAKQRLKEAYDG